MSDSAFVTAAVAASVIQMQLNMTVIALSEHIADRVRLSALQPTAPCLQERILMKQKASLERTYQVLMAKMAEA